MSNLFKWALCAYILALVTVFGSGCATPAQTIAAAAGVTVGTTIVGARSPSHEIEQIYYLGLFDPQEQVPMAVYRVRVRGQASFISGKKFASGWVHSSLVDSLGSHIGLDEQTGHVKITRGEEDPLAQIKTGRRLVLFGPEGFREAPKDHRLVIVMGANPKAFFEAIDQSLGVISEVQAEQANSALAQELFQKLVQIKSERDRLKELRKDLDADVFAGGK